MRMKTITLMSTAALMTATTGIAGDADEVTLRIGSKTAKAGQTITLPISMLTTELVGGFEFTLSAEGNNIPDINWDGPLFSNGWEGWDTSPSELVTVSAACIFTADQVGPGDHLLINAQVEIPADAEAGDFIPVGASNTWFANYAFEIGTVIVVDGGIQIRGSADLEGNGTVGPEDLSALLAQWGMDGPADLDGDGQTDGKDLAMLLTLWGTDG